MRGAWWLLALGLAGCSAPAALEVVVTVEEGELDAITVVVERDEVKKVDCRLTSVGAGGACPFEAGSGRWDTDRELSFVLYGAPDTEALVQLDGMRAMVRDGQQRDVSVTATVAQVRLPPQAGERREVRLALLGRTRPRFSCRQDLDAGTQEGGSAVVVLPNPGTDARVAAMSPQRLLVSVGAQLSRVTYVAGPDGCTLDPAQVEDAEPARFPMRDPTWCALRDGALVAGAGTRVVYFAGVCADGAHLKVGAFLPAVHLQTWPALDSSIVVDGLSDPVLADTDGDGAPEVLVVARTGRDYALLRFRPTLSGLVQPEPFSLGGLAPPPGDDGSSNLYPPLVLRTSAGRDIVVVTGYSGHTFVLDHVLTPASAGLSPIRALPSLWTPALAVVSSSPPAAELVVVLPRQGGAEEGDLARARLVIENRAWKLDEPRRVTGTAGLKDTSGARVVLGHVGMQDNLQAVVFEAGLGTIAEAGAEMAPPPLDVWGGNISGGQQALLANLDGQPGSELLSYSAENQSVHAVWADGESLDGWEDFRFLADLGPRQVLLADLNGLPDPAGVGLRDMEVISLSGHALEVVTLGSGSYVFGDLEWPSAARDPAGTGAWTSLVDPSRQP